MSGRGANSRTICVDVPQELDEVVARQARAAQRSKAGKVRWLIVVGIEAEAQAKRQQQRAA